MRSRLEITEMFSTFAQFNNDSSGQWVTDIKLRRSIENCLKQFTDAPASENFWAIYWYKIWHREYTVLAAKHLSAYLQEPCYYAAKYTINRYTSNQYGLADYFQMAIAEVNKILTKFDPEKNSNLKAYAMMVFPSLLKDILRQRQDADICTNWALLRKVGKKRLVAALQNVGLSPDEVARYKLAWMCFKALYVQTQIGGTQRLPEPDQKLWEAIANLYNTERSSQLLSPGTELKVETIQKWLTNAATWVRKYLYPPVDSLDVPKPGNESTGSWDLPQLACESLLAELIAEDEKRDRQNQISQIHNVLLAALRELAPELQQILQMYYKQNLTQTEIAKQFDRPQAWVSRRLNKARELLLGALIQSFLESPKNQQQLYIPSNSNQLEHGSVALEEWLQVRSW
ncbi:MULTISPECIES: sigma-70 family RNA polymerase sigma factor [Calothrix]|uniref:Sigma-70 family RNA polymerase sigma factor n=2 Tax=Calothrix TaxID=1186 RepID=A0ABR8AKB6_9CYAN|nr:MULTISPECIES: sigma-70 family RNA polymerase sigma factor [Calothrix]MBD2199965.1 sigma-70 family RNA polymerase sigma factor [Calothrix parietina FACHB-288]MBD2228868.1 sigma-70 family RNA polymerase sigma factor [Calothrix anomala FACHB-343]